MSTYLSTQSDAEGYPILPPANLFLRYPITQQNFTTMKNTIFLFLAFILPFLALGRMDGRKDQIVLVEQGHARLAGRGVRRIEG